MLSIGKLAQIVEKRATGEPSTADDILDSTYQAYSYIARIALSTAFISLPRWLGLYKRTPEDY